MSTTTSIENRLQTTDTMPPVGTGFPYKTIAIYPSFADAGRALVLLKQKGFTSDQISLLGREQDGWQERLGNEWKTLHTAEGALAGAALGAIPGLVLVAGVALTGGVGLLVAGPMVAALTALGMGAFGGSVMGGGAANDLDRKNKEVNVELEVEEAIGNGQWVIVAQSHDEAEALRAQALLPDSRIVMETISGTQPI
jgi:hypothetical protein